jgi:hypothetical protein
MHLARAGNRARAKEKEVGKRMSLWITAGLVAASLAAVVLAYGCTKPEDPAEAMLKAQGVSSAPAAKPAGSAPADAGKPAAGPSAGGAAPAAPAGGKDAAKPGAATPATPGGKDAGTAPKAGGAAEAGKEAKAEAGKKGAGEGELSEDERIINFQNLEPKDIILKKYEDMHQKLSEPWNPEKDEADFIPETGRIDPLNPVDSAIPDELKPPRSGETDENQIQTYLVAQACTEAVDAIRMAVQVRNVLKIGAETYVTIAIGDRRASLTVGQAFQEFVGTVGFIPIIVTVMISSASADEVVLDVSATGEGTATTVSKSQIYLPTTFTG